MKVLGIEFDIEQMRDFSFKDFHAKGLDYVCLKRTASHTVKLYFFDGPAVGRQSVVQPHNHRYDFETKVVSGEVINKTYAPNPNGKKMFRFSYQTPLNGGSGFNEAGTSRISLHQTDAYSKGMSYASPGEGFHTIEVRKPGTILFLDQYEDFLPHGSPTFLYSDSPYAPSSRELYI